MVAEAGVRTPAQSTMQPSPPPTHTHTLARFFRDSMTWKAAAESRPDVGSSRKRMSVVAGVSQGRGPTRSGELRCTLTRRRQQFDSDGQAPFLAAREAPEKDAADFHCTRVRGGWWRRRVTGIGRCQPSSPSAWAASPSMVMTLVTRRSRLAAGSST